MRFKVMGRERERKLSLSIKKRETSGSVKQELKDRLIDLPGGSGTETFEDKEESDFFFDICLTQLLISGRSRFFAIFCQFPARFAALSCVNQK